MASNFFSRTAAFRWIKTDDWTQSSGPTYATSNVFIYGQWKRQGGGGRRGQGRKVKCYKVFIRRKDGSLASVGLGTKSKLADAKSLAIKAVNTQNYTVERCDASGRWIVKGPLGQIIHSCYEYVHATNLAPGAVLVEPVKS